jgi:16S rRNA (guanine527-N7)-methyltransferase
MRATALYGDRAEAISTLEGDAGRYGVSLTVKQVGQFERYLDALADWSSRVNLVSDLDAGRVVSRHMVESIALGAALREREILRPGTRLLDVGAGAGFPGAVFAIVWPGVQVTLLEATEKKVRFLEDLVRMLSLEDTEIRSGRAETLAHDPELRESFDLVVARAVAPLRTLSELTLPFARVGGRVVTPKGSRAGQEIEEAGRALAVLGGRVVTAPLRVPGPPQQLVVLIKERSTPDTYPRRPGQPKKAPL